VIARGAGNVVGACQSPLASTDVVDGGEVFAVFRKHDDRHLVIVDGSHERHVQGVGRMRVLYAPQLWTIELYDGDGSTLLVRHDVRIARRPGFCSVIELRMPNKCLVRIWWSRLGTSLIGCRRSAPWRPTLIQQELIVERNVDSSASKADAGPARRGRGRPKDPIRRARLVEISAQLFATQGFKETTVRDIADAAGIMSGSLYHHFESKDAILQEIVRDFLGNLYASYAAIEKQYDDPQQVVDALIRHSLKIIQEAPYSVALYQDEARSIVGAPGYEYIVETSKKNEQVWVRAIEAGKKSGKFRRELDAAVVYRLMRDSVWSVVRWFRPDGAMNADAVSEQYLLMLHHGLLAD
jgi:TetR/AcrR family transcriptional regulator, cholesterol catabolism regulator